jgi:hypothetical protein
MHFELDSLQLPHFASLAAMKCPCIRLFLERAQSCRRFGNQINSEPAEPPGEELLSGWRRRQHNSVAGPQALPEWLGHLQQQAWGDYDFEFPFGCYFNRRSGV